MATKAKRPPDGRLPAAVEAAAAVAAVMAAAAAEPAAGQPPEQQAELATFDRWATANGITGKSKVAARAAWLAASRPRDHVLPGEAKGAAAAPLDVLRDWNALDLWAKRLDAGAKEARERRDAIEPAALDGMIREGMEKVTIDGRTLFPANDVWAGPIVVAGDAVATVANKAALVKALKAAKWTWKDDAGVRHSMATAFLVTEGYNHQSLTAFVRELPRDGKGKPILPAKLAAVLAVKDNPVLRGRKA